MTAESRRRSLPLWAAVALVLLLMLYAQPTRYFLD
jgi:hypothetical protein